MESNVEPNLNQAPEEASSSLLDQCKPHPEEIVDRSQDADDEREYTEPSPPKEKVRDKDWYPKYSKEDFFLKRWFLALIHIVCFSRPEMRELRNIMDMDEEHGLKYNKKMYMAKESVKHNSKHIYVLFFGSVMICFVVFFLSVFISCYVSGIRRSDLTFENMKKAGNAVTEFARGSVIMMHQTSQVFIEELREEYKRRQEYKEKMQKYGEGEFTEHDNGAIGNLPASSVGDGGENGKDPIDWRHSPHPHLSNIIQDYINPGHFLPKVCPMLKNHLEITFNLSETSFDVFGYPCVMEMHWSSKWNEKEIDMIQGSFIQGYDEQHSMFSKGDLSNGGTQYVPPLPPKEQYISHMLKLAASSQNNLGRVNPLVHGIIKCTRRFRLNGFTPWECKPNHKVPSRFSMIYSVGCAEVDHNGDVNVKSEESTFYAQSKDWVDLTASGNNESINPAYDKDINKLQEGHYCYINYAFVPNATIVYALKLLFSGVVICLLSGFFLTMFVITERWTVFIWILSLIIDVLFGVYFLIAFYKSTETPAFVYLYTGYIALFVSILSCLISNFIGMLFVIKQGLKYKENQKPYLIRMIEALMIIADDANAHSPYRFRENRRYEFDQSEPKDMDFQDNSLLMHDVNCTGYDPDACQLCYQESKKEQSFALYPGDRGYGETSPVKQHHKKARTTKNTF